MVLATTFVKIKIDLIHEFLETVKQQLVGNLYIPASNKAKPRKSINLVDSYFAASPNLGAVCGQPISSVQYLALSSCNFETDNYCKNGIILN